MQPRTFVLVSPEGHGSSGGSRLGSEGVNLVEVFPVGKGRSRSLAWGMGGFSHGQIINMRRAPKSETTGPWPHGSVSASTTQSGRGSVLGSSLVT